MESLCMHLAYDLSFLLLGVAAISLACGAISGVISGVETAFRFLLNA